MELGGGGRGAGDQGLVAATVGGAAGSIPHAEDSSSLRETEVPWEWDAPWGVIATAWDGGRGAADWDSRTAHMAP
jgi:hypothetical protein